MKKKRGFWRELMLCPWTLFTTLENFLSKDIVSICYIIILILFSCLQTQSALSSEISSVAVFQQTPRVLTSVSAIRVGPTENLIKDSSSSSTTAFAFSVFVCAILSSLLVMSWSSSLEFEFHLHKLKAPLAISSYESRLVTFKSFLNVVSTGQKVIDIKWFLYQLN